MPTVFLSHSTKGDERAAALRERVRERLTARGWSVLVDEDVLSGGEDWKDVLYQWIADCDAAVILLSAKALASSWVRREVNLLLWRRALGAPITIVPVLLHGTTRAQIAQSEISDLLALQFVRPARPARVLTGGDDLAACVADRLPDLSSDPTAARDGMRVWLDDITGCLTGITQDGPLKAALRNLGADSSQFATLVEGRRLIAHRMLGPTSVERIVATVRSVARPAHGSLRQLCDLVVPIWVDMAAARALIPTDGQVLVLLNATRSETAEHYVSRAACCSLDYRTETVDTLAGEDGEREFQDACEQAVRRLLNLDESYPLDDERPLYGEVCFLVVAMAMQRLDLDTVLPVIRSLLVRFNWLNVVVLTGSDVPSEQALDGWGLAEAVLRPALRSDDEKHASRISGRLSELHRKVVGGTGVGR